MLDNYGKNEKNKSSLFNSVNYCRLVLLEKTTLGTVNTGVNKIETINARDAIFVAVCYCIDRFILKFFCLVIKISCCTRFITFNSSLFRCIKSKSTCLTISFEQDKDSSLLLD
jgi:hypothetical protein